MVAGRLSSTRRLGILITLLGSASCHRVELPAMPEVALDAYPPAIHRQLSSALQRVEKRPRKAEANGRMAMLLHTYDQLQSAEIYYTRAALLDDNDFRWPYLRAWVRADKGNVDGALADLRAALTIDPDYPRARIKLAELLLASGKLDECRETLNALDRDFPGRAEVNFVRGQLALRVNDPQSAISAFDKVYEITANFGALHSAFAQAYRQSGDEPAMRRHTQLAEQYRNTRADVADPIMVVVLSLNISTTKQVERARGFAARGDIDGALQILEDALANDPNSLPVHVTLAGVYVGKGDFMRADEHLQRAAQIDSDHPKLHYNIGITRLAQQHLAAAEQAFRRSLELDSNNADAWTQLGLVLEMSGDADAAIANYRTAVQKDPWHRQAHWLLGRQMQIQGEYTSAIRHLQILRPVRDPASAAILLDLGRAYQASGQNDEAAAVLREAIAAADQFGDGVSRAAASGMLRQIELDP